MPLTFRKEKKKKRKTKSHVRAHGNQPPPSILNFGSSSSIYILTESSTTFLVREGDPMNFKVFIVCGHLDSFTIDAGHTRFFNPWWFMWRGTCDLCLGGGHTCFFKCWGWVCLKCAYIRTITIRAWNQTTKILNLATVMHSCFQRKWLDASPTSWQRAWIQRIKIRTIKATSLVDKLREKVYHYW